MNKVQKIIDNLLKESIFDKANELTEKLLGRLEDDNGIDLEVGSKYEYLKDENSEPVRVIYLGKSKQGGGKFKNEKTNNEILLSKNLIMKRIHELGKNKKTSEMGEGNKFSGELAKARKSGKDSFEVDGKTYKVESNEEYSKKQMFIAKQAKPKNKIDAKDFEVLRNSKKKKTVKEDLGGMEDSHPVFGNMNLMNPSDDDKENLVKYLKRYIKRDHNVEDEYDTMDGSLFDGEDEENDFETLAEDKKFIQKATKKMEDKGTSGKFTTWCKRNGLASEDGEVTQKCINKAMKSDDSKVVKMANFAKNIGGFKGAKHESVMYQVALSENSYVNLTENELVDMIDNIIKEEQITNNLKGGGKAKGLVQYDRVHSKDEDINKKALKDVEKKMKDYVKAGSKGSFEMNPDYFPKGNGELGEMSKKAYQASDAVEEYIENFAYSPGMENLKYDEIEPNEEWVTANIEGSEKTGNSPKYANAVDTGYGKKINKKRKENLYQQEVEKSYNRVRQPVDTAGETKKSGKLDNMFKKLGESTENENTNFLNEEMSKMKKLIGYNEKTQ